MSNDSLLYADHSARNACPRQLQALVSTARASCNIVDVVVALDTGFAGEGAHGIGTNIPGT